MSYRIRPVRLAELVATLSLGIDLGLGRPMDHVVRQTLIALRMSRRLGLDESERAVVFYAGLLAWVGCRADACIGSRWFGDDLARRTDVCHASSSLYSLRHTGAENPWFERVYLGTALLRAFRHGNIIELHTHWFAADALAERLGLGDEVRLSLKESYERWDGTGGFGTKGDDIRLALRVLYLADVVAMYHRTGGIDAAVAVARRRKGAQLDPVLVDLFCRQAPVLLGHLDAGTNWDVVIAGEPKLSLRVTEETFDEVLEAICDFTDLTSPYTIGHSRGVAGLAAAAARIYGLPEDAVVTIRRAALVHDLGRIGVSHAIWDKHSALNQAEFERVRLHPYLSERMLAFSPTLALLGAIGVQHHERLDGSGYPRGLSGDQITPAGRILGAADTFRAMAEVRPYRPARSPEEAMAALRAEVTAGRLEGNAVNAVLRAAGH